MWIKLNYGDMYIKVKMVARNENEKKLCNVAVSIPPLRHDAVLLFGVTISGREGKKTARNVTFICYMGYMCLVYSGCAYIHNSVYLFIFYSLKIINFLTNK